MLLGALRVKHPFEYVPAAIMTIFTVRIRHLNLYHSLGKFSRCQIDDVSRNKILTLHAVSERDNLYERSKSVFLDRRPSADFFFFFFF